MRRTPSFFVANMMSSPAAGTHAGGGGGRPPGFFGDKLDGGPGGGAGAHHNPPPVRGDPGVGGPPAVEEPLRPERRVPVGAGGEQPDRERAPDTRRAVHGE